MNGARRRAGWRVSIVIAVAASSVVLSALPSAAHVKTFDNKVTIQNDGGSLSGSVTSPKAACTRGRDVAVFRVTPGAGKDDRVGKAEFAGGEWTLDASDITGEVYAKVTSKTFGGYGHTHTCPADRSRTITL
ncbi:MAG TPA: hypothetical protein VNC78_06640 [Actinomycetota bacterium]|nr:hypothetical protein [Actinomycetota bacterium]